MKTASYTNKYLYNNIKEIYTQIHHIYSRKKISKKVFLRYKKIVSNGLINSLTHL